MGERTSADGGDFLNSSSRGASSGGRCPGPQKRKPARTWGNGLVSRFFLIRVHHQDEIMEARPATHTQPVAQCTVKATMAAQKGFRVRGKKKPRPWQGTRGHKRRSPMSTISSIGSRGKRSRLNGTIRKRLNGKCDHGRILNEIVERPIDSIKPSPENELLYRAVSNSDPETISISNSIARIGVKEPLVATIDGYILSGHRRHAGAKLAGLKTVPCRIENIRRTDPGFIELLREYNRQRVKTLAEVTREEVVSADPEEGYRLLVEHRREQSHLDAPDAIEIIGHKHRAEITKAKRPFLDAILAILQDRRVFWPLSVRVIHYVLLNAPPLIHASKPRSVYANTNKSYKAAIDLCARGRLAGCIPWNAIDDVTRPITTWDVHSSIAPFVRRELDRFLKNYYRDLQQSQPNHIEIVGEKNTIDSIIRPVAMEYAIPYTIGRGYSSLSPRWKMAQRFNKSGKEKLILFVLSDHDPEGEDIPHSFARSMRDDFNITNIMPIKVALTAEQVADLHVTSNSLETKKNGSRYSKFVERYGPDGYELEAVPPAELQRMLRRAIDRVLDVKAFNSEIEAEKMDAAHLDGVRRAVQAQLASVKFE
jgi:hypothetical protein